MRSAAIALVFLSAATVPAQIVLKPAAGQSAPLRPKTLDLDVTIRKGVAESKFDYVFANEGEWRGEADFLIAIPENGVVTGFAYWYEGEKVIARVAEKERARDIYKAITTRQRDPALIEMVGKRTFRVKVFPVQANADLRVELKMVQALPSTVNGPQLAIPLKRLGRLEKLDVNVTGDGPFASSLPIPAKDPNGKTLELRYQAVNVTTPDLKVTAIRPKRPFVADLRAARSGGSGGFFALTLTAANGLQRPRLSFSGVTVKDVMGVPSRMAPGKAYTVVGRYENVRPGAKLFLAGASGARFSEPLDFSSAPEPNGPAAKLWAWAKIGASTNRKEIVALSMRHTVPSPFTSWIAIPTEERKRFAREIAMGDLRRFGREMTRTIARTGATSVASRRAIAAYGKRAKALGIEPNSVYNEELAAYAGKVSERWTREVKRRGERSASAQRLQSELEILAQLGVDSGTISSYHYSRANALAAQVFRDRMAQRTDAAARRREAELARHAKHTPGQSANSFVAGVGNSEVYKLAYEVARDERAGTPVPPEKRTLLARAERSIGERPGSALAQERASLARRVAEEKSNGIQEELASEEPDEARIRSLVAEREKERKAIEATGQSLPSAVYGLQIRAERVFERVEKGEISSTDLQAFRTRFFELAELAGESRKNAQQAYDYMLGNRANNAWANLRTNELNARRNREALAGAQLTVDRLKAIGATEPANVYGSYRGEYRQEERNAYVKKRHNGEAATEELNALRVGESWKGTEYNRNRADILQTLTELDRMDGRPLSTQEERTKAELERKANELHARIGDPIVTFEAPSDAIGVTAVLPDGTRLPMVWVARHSRWEARFDIPAGTADGPFSVRIDGAYADGRPIEGRAEFLVDTTAPTVRIERDGTRVVLRTEVDVVRAVAFGPDGSRKEMVRSAPGRFVLQDVPEGELQVVATDRAHNRSDMMSVAAAPSSAEPIDASLNVQALVPFGDRLWVSTLDAGGRFEGGEAVPEVGPWPRQAAVIGRTLAVRAATGEVHSFDGLAWTTIERDATTLATSGDSLLVGIVGGWIERPSVGTDRHVVRPAELAGRVVTCLFADGDRLWIGTQGRGLFEWDRTTTTGRWHDERQGLSDDWITALGKDSGGRIVAGTFVGGALTLSEGRWTPIASTAGTCVTAIDGDRIATRSGVFRAGVRVAEGEAQSLAKGWIGWRGRIEADSTIGR